MITINRNSRLQPVKQPVQDDGWLSPNGKFYACGYAEHSWAAEEIAETTVWDLENAGWAHISGDRICNFRSDLTLTQDQINTLFDMMMLNPESELGRNIHKWIGADMMACEEVW